MAVLNEEELMHELLEESSDDDTPAPHGLAPQQRRSARFSGLSVEQASRQALASPNSAGAAQAAGQAGCGPAGQAAAAAAMLNDGQFKRLSGGSQAAAAAAAFARGRSGQTPPCTIEPGSAPVFTAESHEDVQRLRARQRDWAVAVHGSEAAALAAGWTPKDKPDYALYSVYMARIRECLAAPDVDDEASEAGARLCHMIAVFRAYMACLYAGNTFVMEHRHANLATLGDLGELPAEMAAAAGDVQSASAGHGGRKAEALEAAGGMDRSGSGASSGGAAQPPAHSRRSGSDPHLAARQPSDGGDAAAAGGANGGGGPQPRRGSLDLGRSSSEGHRPTAAKLKKAYQDRASMDVRPTIRAIKFTQQQREELLQRRRRLDVELERSQAERKDILARFQALTAGAGTAVDVGMLEAQAALRGNLDAEGRLITDLSAWFTSALLAPLQHARCNATCYPYMPDVIGISDMLAAESDL